MISGMSTRNTTDRRSFLECFARLGLSSTLYPGVLWAQIQQTDAPRITKEILRHAAAVAGMTFTEREFDTMLDAVNLNIGRLEQIRKVPLENAIAPPLYFNPLVPGMKIDRRKQPR